MTPFGNRYVPEDIAHQGGMGTVVVCHDPNLDRKVAIKFLQPGSDKRRIFDEVRALQRIRSKHVVQVFDVVVAQPLNQVGIVQEFLPGDDLSGFHESDPTPDDYLRVLYQLARGLNDIHEQGQIHRDIKPNNAKRDQENIVKIFDFGLSRPHSNAQTVGFVGTVGFAAPELWGSGAVCFTPAVDVYAFSATAVFLACGSLPNEFLETPPRAHDWVAGRGFPTLPLKLPQSVARLLNRALARDPNARPTMASLRQEIERHLVQGQHRALLVHGAKTHALHQGQPTVTLSKSNNVGSVSSMTITYDGLSFSVSKAQGDVFINNVAATVGVEIPACCVITIGAPALKNQRAFITMDVSHPEVVL